MRVLTQVIAMSMFVKNNVPLEELLQALERGEITALWLLGQLAAVLKESRVES